MPHSTTDFSVSPDERQIVYSTNLQGRYDLWALDHNQGYPYPLTKKGQMSFFIKHLPGSQMILTGFDNDGDEDWGGGPRLDIVAGMDWLDRQGKSQAGKWFCVGGSYGGYMALLLHGRHPELFKAFVDQFGPSNLFTTIETAPEHWKAADAELIGDPIVDRDRLIEDSPMTYLDATIKPMLVVQGANDPRVVQKESDAIVEALRGRGQDVEYILLPDEGHGYSKTENAIMVYKAIVEFLAKYI